LGVSDQISRITSGYAPTGLRVDWKRLDDGEAAELVELTRKGNTPEGFRLAAALSERELRKWEALIEKGAEAPDVFEAARKDADLRADLAQLAARAKRAPKRPRFEQRGCVVLPREIVFDWFALTAPPLEIGDLGLLVFVLGQLENGEALTPGGRIEGAGDDTTLIIDDRLGLGTKADPDARLVGTWRDALAHLGLPENGLLEVERGGGHVRVKRGRLIREALSRRAA